MGKRDQARRLLVPVHGLFGEGFGTSDFVEATALIEALKS